MNKYLEEVLNNKHAFTLQSSAFKSKLIILDDVDFNLLCDHIKFSTFTISELKQNKKESEWLDPIHSEYLYRTKLEAKLECIEHLINLIKNGK